MANKRIKISELPRITFIPNATGTTVTATSADYLPIAVTDKSNATVKTTMTITSRELMRFVLQQAAPAADGTDFDLNEKLVIGRTSYPVEIPTLQVGDITVTGTSNFATASYNNMDVTGTLTVGNAITVGGTATYPGLLYDRNNTTSTLTRGIFCSDTSGRIDGFGLSLQSLVAQETIASASNAGLFATVDSSGKLTFQNLTAALGTAKSITSNTGNFGGNILSVGSSGELYLGTAGSGLQLSSTTNVVNKTTADLEIASSDSMLPVVTEQIDSSTSQPITAAAMVTHAQYNSTSSTLSNSANTTGNTEVRRAVFNVPIVLAGKHVDGSNPLLHDLTHNAASAQVPAQIGEIRWNVYNGVPTLYLAVAAHPDVGGSADPDAKTWYGVPLFGTIDDDSTDSLPITAHKYSDDD